jgi:hypothetical protein
MSKLMGPYHPLDARLPQDTVMKSDYQVPVGVSNGIVATGPNIEWATRSVAIIIASSALATSPRLEL